MELRGFELGNHPHESYKAREGSDTGSREGCSAARFRQDPARTIWPLLRRVRGSRPPAPPRTDDLDRPRVGPDLHFHDLRHTGAVLGAATGATLAELMQRLGHTTAGAAMRYQHAASDRDAQIAEALSLIAEQA